LPLEVIEADLERAEHQRAVRELTAAYALDPMGNGGPLPADVLDRLVPSLRSHPTTLIFLAFVDGQPVALATCFKGFSTFAAAPLISVSDFAVLPKYRGRGIARALLAAIEGKARELGCCKLTLEVQENNSRARRVYEKAGFSQAMYGVAAGSALHYWKILSSRHRGLERAASRAYDERMTEQKTNSETTDDSSVAPTDSAAEAPDSERDESDAEPPDSALEVEPEVIAVAPDLRTARSLHPPPPPRLRESTAIQGRRLEVLGTPKRAADLMTRQILTIGPDDKLQMLEEQMERFRFRHLPVVEGDKLVGLISHSDLLHASSSYLSDTAKERNAIIHQLPASRIMLRDFVTVRPTEPLAAVAALMWKTRLGCVLVTDDEQNLLGIITEGDFVRLAHHFLVQEPE
jgi:predicted transcriptional regulator/GNAT superfamily N-acetyltransferase